jgi:flagellar motor switch protein FliM
MGEALSQDEISSLLEQDSGQVSLDEYKKADDQNIATYDFRRPNRISKEQLRSIRSLHSKFSRELSSKISSAMRTIIEVTLHSVDQMTYGEFLMSLPSPTSFNIFSMRPLEGNSILEINPSVIFPIIDKLLGGEGIPYENSREFTDIEFLMIDNILNIVMGELMGAWAPYISVSMEIEVKESSPNVLQVVAQNEFIVMCVLEIIIGDSSGMMNVCYPVIYLEPILQKLANRDIMMYDRQSQKSRNKELRTLASFSNAFVEAIIGTTLLPLSRLTSLDKGDIILFSKEENEDIIIRINNKEHYYASLGANEYRKVVIIKSTIETEQDRAKQILKAIEHERAYRLNINDEVRNS